MTTVQAQQREKERLSFEIDELNKLFSHLPANWRELRAPRSPREHLGWLMVLGLYQGARLEEIAGLEARDIQTEHGITFLDITPRDGRPLKTRAAERRAPLHVRVIDLGFLDYANRYRGDDPIFPALKPGGPDKKRSWSASKSFGFFKRNTCGITYKRKVFHSFRQIFVTALQSASVDEKVSGPSSAMNVDSPWIPTPGAAQRCGP